MPTLAVIPQGATTYTATILPNPNSLPVAVLNGQTLTGAGAVFPAVPGGGLTLGFAGLYNAQTTYKFQTVKDGEAPKTGAVGPVHATAVATPYAGLEGVLASITGGSNGAGATATALSVSSSAAAAAVQTGTAGSVTVLSGTREGSTKGDSSSTAMTTTASTTTTTTTRGGSTTSSTSTTAAAVSSATGAAGRRVMVTGGMVGIVGAVVALL